MSRILPVLAVLLLAAGCTPSPMLYPLEGGSVMATDKTIGDHIVSWASGKDCSSVRWEQGKTYCKEDELHVEPAVFCYKTLGDSVCYDRPDPYHNNEQKTGEYGHNLPK